MKMRTTCMAALMAFASMAVADVITPVSVTFTGTATELAGLNLDNENNIINGSGLSAPLTDLNLSTVTHAAVTFSAPGNAWVTTDPGGYPSDFFAVPGHGSVTFKFDLGSLYSLSTFASWGYHFGGFNGNSMSRVTLDFSTDGGLTTDSSQTIDVPLPTAFDLATVVGLTPVNANFVTMSVTDNHFGNADGGDRVGLAEIAFQGAAVPEPTSLGLMALAAATLLIARKRRV